MFNYELWSDIDNINNILIKHFMSFVKRIRHHHRLGMQQQCGILIYTFLCNLYGMVWYDMIYIC